MRGSRTTPHDHDKQRSEDFVGECDTEVTRRKSQGRGKPCPHDTDSPARSCHGRGAPCGADTGRFLEGSGLLKCRDRAWKGGVVGPCACPGRLVAYARRTSTRPPLNRSPPFVPTESRALSKKPTCVSPCGYPATPLLFVSFANKVLYGRPPPPLSMQTFSRLHQWWLAIAMLEDRHVDVWWCISGVWRTAGEISPYLYKAGRGLGWSGDPCGRPLAFITIHSSQALPQLRLAHHAGL
jgi:hypothetical protein